MGASKLFVVLLLIFTPILSQTNNQDIIVEALYKLSADAMWGRRAGTEGNVLATKYLSSKMEELGLEKFNDKFTQEFSMFTKMEKSGKNKVFERTTQTLPNFEPLSFSKSGKIKSKGLVFAGFGITIPEDKDFIEYDDYKDIDVEDKIVIIMSGDPAIGNMNSGFRDPKYIAYRSIYYKISNAIKHGAAGLLLVQNPLSLKGKKDRLRFSSQEGGGQSFNILAGQVMNSWVSVLLRSKKYEGTLELQKQISDSQKPNSFVVKNSPTDMEVNLRKITGRVSNVIGFLPGSDEKLQYEAVIFGAHFDHLGMGGSESNEPDTEPKIHHGADDNGSGTAFVLSLIEKLKKTDHKRTYVFAFFNAEEMGLLGSKHMAENFERLAGSLQMKAMLNFDMVGRFDKKLSIIGVGSALEWGAYLNEYLSKKNKNDLPVELNTQTLGSSDHASFINNKVPSLFFTTGAHEDYHKSTDTFEKINFDGLKSLESMVLSFSALLEEKLQITFDPDSLEEGDGGRSRGYGSHLGCVPDMGSGDKITGVLCTRFVKDSPAKKAGLLPGDILVGIGDIAINNIYDLSFALKFHRPGDEIELRWMREGVEMKATITLTQRKAK